MGGWLGLALAGAVNFLNPEKIVIGGGIAQAGDLLFGPIGRAIRMHAFERPAAAVSLVPAALGAQAGMIGAAVLRSIHLLSVGMESFAARMVEGAEPNRARIAELVDRSLMLVTALAPAIGYDNAAKIAKYAHEKDLTLKQAGLELALVDEATFDRLVRPEDMVGRGE